MSNHKAIVAKIERVSEIPNATNIQVGHVLGENVIISKDIQPGYVGILFPEGVQLSEKFCSLNNLFRNAEWNSDKEKKGFFEESRRVRAQKFMGIKSTAYFTSLASVSYVGNHSYNLGDQFDELNGEKICQKYYSQRTLDILNKQGKQNVKQAKKDFAPYFEKHVDSEQFKHHVHLIPKGALLSFHAKKHGCFPSNQRILMADGTKKNICNVDIGDKVVGFSEQGVPTVAVVLDTPRNGQTTEWVDVRFTRTGYTGNKDGNVVCTKDHLFLVEEDGVFGWKEAGTLNVGEKLVFVKQTLKPTDTQIQAILGKFIGDGYFSSSGNLQFSHKLDHESYLDYCSNIFGNLKVDKKDFRISGYGTKMVRTMLKSNPFITKMLKDNQRKGIPKCLSEWMVDICSPLTLAIWYMDDGSLTSHPSQEDRASLAICRYSDNDVEIVKKMFAKFGINVVCYVDSRKYWRVRLNALDAYKFFHLIAPYVPEPMRYKLPEELRSLPCYEFTKEETTAKIDFHKDNQLVTKVSALRSDVNKKKYDLTTSTGNFVASEVVVHNSSFRVAKTLVNNILPKWKTWINRQFTKHSLNTPFPEQSWQTVVGTRNVIISTPDKEGFHGSEQFRFDVAKELEPFLVQGMTIYGEIVGYVNGKPIMPRHSIKELKSKEHLKKYGELITYSYGCAEHEYKYHIYRITYLNHNGENMDMSQKQLEAWCSARNLPYTLEVAPQMIYDGDVEKLRSFVEDLTERNDVLTEDFECDKHIAEGVIVRCDDGDGLTPKFYKSKSYAFRVMEGLCDAVDTEDVS